MAEDRCIIRHSLRGIGPKIVTLYLTDLGGRVAEPGQVIGEGWEARVARGTPVSFGMHQLGVTDLEISGPAETVQRLWAAFEKKAIRAGG